MFALRKIIENTEYNYALGVAYSLINRETNYKEFCEEFEKEFGYNHVSDLDEMADDYTTSCYCFIITNDFKSIPLYKGQKNYIVTDGGKTYANLTYK